MPVNESVRSRESNSRLSEFTPTRTESGLARLRQRLSGSASLDAGDRSGLSDPFAEIFARIATADAPPPVEAPTDQTVQADAVVDETDTVEEDSSAVDETTSDVAPEIAAIQVDEPVRENVEPEPEATTTETTTLKVVDPQTQSSSDNEQDETAQADTVAPAQSNTETEVALTEVEPESNADESVVDADVALAASKSKERRSSESNEVIAVDNQVKTETTPASVSVEPTSGKQTTENAPANDGDDPKQSQQSNPQAVEANVERRRYSDDKATSNEPAGDGNSSANESSESVQMKSDAQRASAAASHSTRSNANGAGIDVSSMTPVSAAASVASAAVNAVAANASIAAGGASNVGAKPNATSVVSGSAVSGSAATADASEAPIGLDSSGKNNRADASSKTGPGNAVAGAGADTLSAVQRAKLVQRVSRGFQHLGPNGGQIRMRLSPDALGSIQLQLNIRGGELSGTMVTQTEAASQALREQLPQLRSALESQGIRMENIEIQTESASSTMDSETSGQRFGDASGQSGNPSFGQSSLAGQRTRSGWSDVRATPRSEPTAAPVNTWSSHGTANATGVDLQV